MNDMKILLPLDDSPQAQRTVKTVLAMKDKFRNCTLSLLHVFVLEKINYRGIPASQFEMIEEKAAVAEVCGHEDLLAALGRQISVCRGDCNSNNRRIGVLAKA
jgi:hypothetical protein